MKVTFLGTADGVPTKNRSFSSTMIETNGSIYLIDAGAPVLDYLLKHDKHPNDVKGIFLTHSHADHCSGLHGFLWLTGWYYTQAQFDIFATDKHYIDAFINYSDAVARIDKSRTRFNLASEGVVYTDENVKITYFRTHHDDPKNCYSILVECEGKKLFFSGDLSVNLNKNDFPRYPLEKHVHLFVLELTHFKFNVIEPYLNEVKADSIYFNHANPLFFKDIEKAQNSNRYPQKLVVAKDNQVIEI